MAAIVNSVANAVGAVAGAVTSIVGLVHGDEARDGGSSFINLHNAHGTHDESENYVKGTTYDKIAMIVDKYWPDATEEERTEIYNSIKSAVDSASIFLQHCKEQDIQFRTVELKAVDKVKGEINEEGKHDIVFVNQLANFYDQGKEFYKQASNIKYIGAVLTIKNTSSDNGNCLDISISRKTTNSDLTDPESYDGTGSNISLYNKDVFRKFLPASKIAYKTKSINEIINKFSNDVNFENVKETIFKKLAELLDMDVKDIKNSSDKIRCIDKSQPIEYDNILDYEAFKERCAGITDLDAKYPGTIASIYDTYIKLTTLAESTPFTISCYGIFMLDKSVNKNINSEVQSDDKNQYIMSPASAKEIYDTVDDTIKEYVVENGSEEEDENGSEEEDEYENEQAKRKFMNTKIKIAKKLYGKVVVKDGKYVKPYEGAKLEKGEKVLSSNGCLFNFK